MRTTKQLFTLFLFASLLFFISCKKTDTISVTENLSTNSIVEKFFNSHRTADPTEKVLIDFLKRVNEKDKFLEKTVAKIGYPRWDKAITNAKKKVALNARNLLGDSTQTFYIPFVRDSQNYVNAAMVIKISPTDTTFTYRCDWQYAQFVNDSTTADVQAKNVASFFMTLDKAVFEHSEFKITDKRLFKPISNTNVNDTTDYIIKKVILVDSSNSINSNNLLVFECTDITIFYECSFCHGNDPDCPLGGTWYENYHYCDWTYYPDPDNGGGSTSPGGGGNPVGGSTPPDCGTIPIDPLTMGRIVDPCNEGPGWEPLPIDDDPIPVMIDVVSDPNAPEYPDISDSEPQVSLQSLFNCFAQIPDAGATYSVKLSVDLPVNGVWNAPFNLTQKSPGHTFLTLTKTNGTQTISQSVGFYPIGSGGNPLNPNATGGFKNNGLPNHEYNSSIKADNLSASQFSMAMNNLLSHENDIYNISNNNCTTIALNAFNLLITPKITIEPFVVQMPTNPPQAPYFFMQSPQKLYKAIDSFQPGTGLSKEFNVNNDSPLSTNICP